MLSVRNLTAGYDEYQVLWGPSFDVEQNETVAILGPNGCGKSTMMASISGILPLWTGDISFLDQPVNRLPAHQRFKLGLSHVLERRRLFPFMTVFDNLLLGSLLPNAKARRAETLEWIYSLFPILHDRSRQLAHSLSGGEQQMLAIARGLMSRPQLLLLDEPLLGLAPSQIERIVDVIRTLQEDGVTVVFIEQNVEVALELADRCVLLRDGEVVIDAPADTLDDNLVMSAFLGEGQKSQVERSKEDDRN